MYARRFAPNAHASLRICLPAHAARTLYCSHASHASTGGSIGTLRACARPVDNDSVSACAPGTACRTPTLRCVVIFLRTGFSASYHLRLCMSNGRSRAFLHRAAGRQHFVSLCRYKCCALFPSQLAPLLSPCTMDQRFSLRPICHASLRRYPCPLVAIVAARRPGGLPSAPSLLRKTAPFFCHRQRSQLCPCGSGSGAVL